MDKTPWDKVISDRRPDYGSEAKVPTRRGDFVRSKSESTIADRLLHHGLLYRIEFPLIVWDHRTQREIEYFPDFMILHPLTNEIIIWEHFGLIDSENYRNRCIKKLNDYSNSGYTIGKNLIISFETESMPFVSKQAEEIINGFFY